MKNPVYIDVDGTRTRYFESGGGSSVLLVHGGHFGAGSCCEDWELNFDQLASTFHVVAVDKLGMGFTDNPRTDSSYTVDAQVDHLYKFMQAMGMSDAHLIGHSRGGYAVTRLAIDHPEYVRSLTIVDSSSVINPFNPIYAKWRNEAASMPLHDAVRHLLRANSYGNTHITEERIAVGVAVSSLAKVRTATERMEGGLYESFKQDLLRRVEELKHEIGNGAIQVPTLLFWGFNDPSATMERCGVPALNLFLSAVDHCEMHIVNQAGHASFRERADEFNGAVRDFLNRCDLISSAHEGPYPQMQQLRKQQLK